MVHIKYTENNLLCTLCFLCLLHTVETRLSQWNGLSFCVKQDLILSKVEIWLLLYMMHFNLQTFGPNVLANIWQFLIKLFQKVNVAEKYLLQRGVDRSDYWWRDGAVIYSYINKLYNIVFYMKLCQCHIWMYLVNFLLVRCQTTGTQVVGNNINKYIKSTKHFPAARSTPGSFEIENLCLLTSCWHRWKLSQKTNIWQPPWKFDYSPAAATSLNINEISCWRQS